MMENRLSIEKSKNRKSIIIFTAISVFVYLETAVLPYFISPKNYFEALDFTLGGLNGILLMFSVFCFLLAFMLFRKNDIVPREKPRYLMIFFHFISFILMLFFLSYLIKVYPTEPLPQSNFISKIFMFFSIGTTYFTIRFKLVYIAIACLCHASLLLIDFDIKKIVRKYFISAIPATLLLFSLQKVNSFMWPILCVSTAKINLAALKILNFKDGFIGGNKPIIGTGSFTIKIGAPCSGMEGITLFLIIFLILIFVDRKKLNFKKAPLLALIGVFIMFLANNLRILTILLIGHFYSPEVAIKIFHAYYGVFLYLIIILMIFKVSYKWMLKS